jgi:bifunctional enzyme CysN/CysC
MDLVDYDESVFKKIVAEYSDFATKLSVADITFIPISALKGDNVVHKSDKMPWYEGPTLLHHLENVKVGVSRNLIDFRFPVQSVSRPHQDFRGFAGQISSGSIAPGEEIVVLPSGKKSKVRSIVTFGSELDKLAGDFCGAHAERRDRYQPWQHDCARQQPATIANQLECTICWLHETPLNSPTPTFCSTPPTAGVPISRAELPHRCRYLHRKQASRCN